MNWRVKSAPARRAAHYASARRDAAPPFSTEKRAQRLDDSPHYEDQKNQNEDRNGECNEGMTPDEHRDRGDRREFRRVRDAIRYRLGRSVDCIPQPELRAVCCEGKTTAEKTGGNHHRRAQVVGSGYGEHCRGGRADHALHRFPQARDSGNESDEELDRKSTRLNSSHSQISYAVFCLKK